MNVKALFETTLSAAIKAKPDAAREINAIVQFTVTGTGGGVWTLDAQRNPPTVTAGPNASVQCLVEANHDDVIQMLTDPQSWMQLYFQGRLRVSGDLLIAMKLASIAELVKALPK